MKRLFNRKHSSPTATPPSEQAPPLGRSSPPPRAALAPPVPQSSQGANPGYSLPPPPRIENVGNAIGWSIAMPTFDFPYLLSLSDYLSSSSHASKDAAKALRTEFKHGAPIAQERAVRLTGILMRNTDHRFREQVASKKFLGELTDLVSSKKTEPPVKDMVFRVLSPLAYEYRDDSDLKIVTQTFNKLVSTPSTSLTSFPSTLDPSSRAYQHNGAPLDPEDPLFTPTGLLPSSSTRSGRPSRGNRAHPGRESIPKEIDKVQMRELGERADKGRGLARLLREAIEFNGHDDSTLEENEMVQEFQTQCVQEQEVLGENLVWATVQAEKSRESAQPEDGRDRDGTSALPHEAGEADSTAEQREMRRSRLSSNNPFADVVGNAGRAPSGTDRKTEEELILEKILVAHSEIHDALSMLSSRSSRARQDAQHARDLETATALSKTFVKGGDDLTAGGGNYGEGGSTQRWATVEEREQQEHEAMLREQEALKRYERQQAAKSGHNDLLGLGQPDEHLGADRTARNTTQGSGEPAAAAAATTASPYYGLEALEGLSFSSQPADHPVTSTNPNSFSSSNPYSNLSVSTHPPAVDAAGATQDPFQTESPINSSFVPPQPSEKALGKLRRISTTGTSQDDHLERQQVLEEQLREKYRRNVEERARERGTERSDSEGGYEGGIRQV
ncbi:uncharacterized protein JCM15063_002473 [Sporobolomyces koalae]|uniref:uncharacterized protein n=1 Tax=Sporobolomyces koalae TaxID=500713 RepID=UPI00317D4A2B